MVRAAWMYEVALLGNFLGERTDTPTSLAAAYLGILAPNPARIYDLGLQLSFGAVYAMILLCPMLEEGMQKISWKPLRQTLSAGLAAAIGTFPITNNLSNYYWLPNLAANALATLYSLALIPLLLALSALYLVFGRLVAFLGGFGASLLDLFEWFTLSCTKYERIGIYLPSLLGGVVVLWYLASSFARTRSSCPGGINGLPPVRSACCLWGISQCRYTGATACRCAVSPRKRSACSSRPRRGSSFF